MISVAGAGTYVDDVRPAGRMIMAVLRSPHAHARIVRLDISAAAALPEVSLVLDGASLAADGIVVRPGGAFANFTVRQSDRVPLAVDVVRYVGEPVVAVVAVDLIAARAALELVDVEYAPLPVLADASAALTGQPLEQSWPDNVMVDYPFSKGDPDVVLAGSDRVRRGSLRCGRIAASPIEPRGIVASWDPYRETLTCWASTQSPHVLRTLLAATVGLSDSAVRVIQPQVGGAFGSKLPMFPEDVLATVASIRLGVPVAWTEQRNEYLTAAGHSRDVGCDYAVAFRPDGRITALTVDLVADLGAPTTVAGWAMCIVTAGCIPGAYQIDDVRVRMRGVVTNRGPWQAYRGFGKEVSCFVMERILDEVARATGVDRIEVRLRNFIPSSTFPYTQPCGWITDSGDYEGTLTEAAKLIDYADFERRRAEAREQGRTLGIGFAHELTPEGSSRPDSLMGGTDSATVRISPRGDVTVLTGVTSPGTGNETGIAQVVADALGCDLERVRVEQGDTASCPYGNGNYSSRSLTFGATSARLAADELRERIEAVAVSMLGTDAGRIRIEEGTVHGPHDATLTLDAVAAEIYRNPHGRHMTGLPPGLEATRSYRIPNVHHQPDVDGRYNQYPTWSFASAACVVEVDEETGVVRVEDFVLVHDSGEIVNPLLAEAQLHGAVLQGIGASLYEEISYDEDARPFAHTLREYTLPGARESLAPVIGHRSTPSPFTLDGRKGVGESGISAPAAAIASAIEDALREHDVRLSRAPFTPARVWAALNGGAA
ncbi:xanthine dehydrogenase family protein molybdopterin-binding subunit [Streptomyces malaysiensis]|uniref:Xanthine dehydrogenase family protein molybdopterin-binding subunit n=1 Tax=Streptomyces malaysiensis subsp. samsunensis TaxID=459658 RepID=A0A9X2M739_STRMQ|nr:xanthine dehydrogenase family protein molybdopterin-binding subunit [Streptomyces samsunensis]MCQ8836301.1 xanthine dehydrogenase family protein molybdopterin-binding subunit [Streptomyces samsunensis]